jgi:hypothetical protein
MRCTCENPVLVAPQPPTVLCLICGGMVVFRPPCEPYNSTEHDERCDCPDCSPLDQADYEQQKAEELLFVMRAAIATVPSYCERYRDAKLVEVG